MPSVLVTGANGFIGNTLCRKLLGDGFQVRGTVRANKSSRLPEGIEPRVIADIDKLTDWSEILRGVDMIVHLAARVHVLHDTATDPLAEYLKVNVAATEQLARAAVEASVKRFIFMSTVKVNGEGKVRPYREIDPPAPVPLDFYAISKLQAEQQLKKITTASGMELVILRPPLVYGPGVKAKFLALIKIVAKGVPLPLASLRNRRSFIYLENLVDVIVACCNHPDAGGKVFMVSDGEDVSTPELIRRIARTLKKKIRLFPFPPILLHILGHMMGKGQTVDKLSSSLAVDITKIKNELEWHPPFTMASGLKKTADWFKESNFVN
jgi:nucleoside-diphosphate-sugar epimerase